MTKARGNTEKAAKHATLEMIGLTRSSSQEVADGYGPSIRSYVRFWLLQIVIARGVSPVAISAWRLGLLRFARNDRAKFK